MADDFTGANDVGARFREYGLSVVSAFEYYDYGSDVTVIDTGTRNIPDDKAYLKVCRLFCEMKKNGFEHFYKKIDSTLRGNVKSEIKAIIDNINDNEKVFIIPAFPDNGRIIKDGIMYVGGVLLSESEFSRDPIHPIKESRVSNLTGGDLITLEQIRGDLAGILKDIKSRVIIFDTETNEDLDKIAKTLFELGFDKYVAGSEGIMKYFPDYWKIKRDRVLIVSGSCNDKNIEQVKLFEKEYNEELIVINLNRAQFELEKYTDNEKKDILIKTISEKNEMLKSDVDYTFSEAVNGELSKFITCKTAQAVKKIINDLDIRKIIIAGGETSAEILKEIGVKAVQIASEIQIGVPIMNSLDMKYSLITKPGGFGDKKIFFRCYEKLKSAENSVRQIEKEENNTGLSN